MTDVFISYARVDSAIANRLAEDCKQKGLSVWMDTSVTAGSSFRKEILDKLNSAKSVFVIWSPNSVSSQWVISEAQRALALNKLIPVRTPDLDVASIPPPFDTFHTPELVTGELNHINKARRTRQALTRRSWLKRVLLTSVGVGLFIGVGLWAKQMFRSHDPERHFS